MTVESGNPCDVENQLNVCVFYGSWHIGARIVHSISRIGAVHIKGQLVNTLDQSRESEAAAQIISQRMLGVAIIDAELCDANWSRVLEQSKRLDIPPIVIMAAGSNYTHYRRLSSQMGADYFFELPSELRELRSTIAELAEGEVSRVFADAA